MLVISRKKGESIIIGKDIEVTIVAVSEGNVKVSINAPKNISILRKELYVEITEENKNSLQQKDTSILKNIKNFK